MTLVGALTLLFVYLFMREDLKTVNVIAGRIAISLNTEYRFGGVSLGLFYMVHYKYFSDTSLHSHEIGHTIQNVRWGPLFPLVIGLPSIIRAAFFTKLKERHFKKHGEKLDYESIWFEGNATKLGNKYISVKEIEHGIHKALDKL